MLSTGTKLHSMAVLSEKDFVNKSPIYIYSSVRQTLTSAALSKDLRSSNVHSRSQRSRRSTSHIARSAQAEVGKLISKVEIPPFIPRVDLIDQLLRWAVIEVQENGMANVGCPCKVTPYSRDEMLWGFTISFLKDGESATDVRVAFDDEVTLKHEWVGRGAGLLPNGFPILEGNAEEILGKHFEIRKIDEKPVSEDVRSSVRDFCQMLVGAINKYYAFGSCFVDDST